MRRFSVFALFACGCFTLVAQGTPGQGRPEFEVASVRPAALLPPEPGIGGGRGGGSGGDDCGVQKLTVKGDRVNYICVPLRGLISYAFGIRPVNLIKGPEWMIDTRFDIAAKLPSGASEDQVPQMFQTLLADRFRLAVHRENLEQPASGLVVKGVLKLKEGSLKRKPPSQVPMLCPQERPVHSNHRIARRR